MNIITDAELNFEYILDNIPSGVLIYHMRPALYGLEAEAAPVYMSRRACEILGCNAGEYADSEKNEHERLIPSLETLSEGQLRALSDGRPLDRIVETSRKYSDAEEARRIWLRAVCALIRSGGENYLYFTIIDITDGILRHKAEIRRTMTLDSLLTLEFGLETRARIKNEPDVLASNVSRQGDNDPLTGLLNRTAFEKKLIGLLPEFESASDPKTGFRAMLIIELTSLSEINRRYGYIEGDRVLMKMADTIFAFQRDGDFCARIRAAEFVFFSGSPQSLTVLKERIRILFTALSIRDKGEDETSEIPPETLYIGASIFPTDITATDGASVTVCAELFCKADRALCHAKSRPKAGYVFYSPEMEDPPKNQKSDWSAEDNTLPENLDAESPCEKSGGETKRVFIRAMGYFDVFVDGRAIMFRLAKVKELLAILVDRRGGFVTASDAIARLWENEPSGKLTLSRYRKVAMRLKNQLEEYGISDIIEINNGSRRIIPERISCDYYNYLSGSPEYRSLFKGAYLTNYSWAEDTLASLETSGTSDTQNVGNDK